MPKFYVNLTGQLVTVWGIEVEAEDEEQAKKEALLSAPDDPDFWGRATNAVTDIQVTEVEQLTLQLVDRHLGRLELEEIYTAKGGEHHEHTKGGWFDHVAEGYTLLGYWDWVYQELQNEDEPNE
jgi:hypothetical protein